MDVLLVVDMQRGLLEGDPKHDLDAVVDRIRRVADRVRESCGRVVFIQHDGGPGDDFEVSTDGWEILDELERKETDLVVGKTLNDPFHGTELESRLRSLGAERVIITGWATDFCVDSTVRSAVTRGFDVVVLSDAHTCGDRPHLGAAEVIEHHNWVWSELIARRSVRLLGADEYYRSSE